jgi:hypothetical protein
MSYRREMLPHTTGRIYDGLTSHFGETGVFFDMDAIGSGTPNIEEVIPSAEAVVVIVRLDGQRPGTRRAQDTFMTRRSRVERSFGFTMWLPNGDGKPGLGAFFRSRRRLSALVGAS